MDSTDLKLAIAARESPDKYYETAIAATRSIHARLNASNLLTGSIEGTDAAGIKELLCASLVLNDCTSVVFNNTKNLKVHLPEPYQYKEMFGTDAIRFNITPEQIQESGIDPVNPSIRPCLIYSASNAQRPLMATLMPFIEQGAVVFQPSRGVLTKKKEARSWHILGVDSKQPLDQWEPDSSTVAGSPVPMKAQGSPPSTGMLFEVMLPYLKGVPLRELGAMLTNETDLVVAFRTAIRSAVREATKSGVSTAEFFNDTVQPKVRLLDRKLRSLQRIHRIKVGGAAMSSVALAFTSASAGTLGGSLLALASAGGFGFIANQYSDYLSKRSELEQDPYYFLWLLRRSAKPEA